ncbi:MAG TPA: hypothetical protein VE570_14910 [Thermoleophilaceae bacterium]|nr:hypothetical protein [Thermoleophilaceae bacterium]
MRFVPVAIVCCFLAACGGGGDSQAKEVRGTVEGWLSTLSVGKEKGDSARACAYLTPALRKSIDQQLRMRGEHAKCRTFAANWTGRSTPPGNRGAHVTDVVIKGNSASAGLAAPPDRTSEVKLRKLGGHWLIENY